MDVADTSINELLDRAEQQLRAAGVMTPRADAEGLACHVLGMPSTELVGIAPFGPARAQFDELVERRAQRVPLAHLTGHVRFRGITLQVGPGVFTPQPETSAVVGWVVRALLEQPVASPLAVDLCTGAGTMALTLANEIPGLRMHGVELDPAALAWARRNATARAAVGDPLVQMHLGSIESCLPDLDGKLDLVVSNPPYVGLTEAHIPSAEVVGHDPADALWAGDDGLDVIRLVERTAARLLKVGGLLTVEHSDRQGRSAPALFTATGNWVDVEDHQDDDGLDRFVTARRAPSSRRPPA